MIANINFSFLLWWFKCAKCFVVNSISTTHFDLTEKYFKSSTFSFVFSLINLQVTWTVALKERKISCQKYPWFLAFKKFEDYLKTIWRLFEDYSKTVRRLFEDYSKTIRRLFKDYSKSIRRLFKDYLKIIWRLFEEPKTIRRVFEGYSKTIRRVLEPYSNYFS